MSRWLINGKTHLVLKWENSCGSWRSWLWMERMAGCHQLQYRSLLILVHHVWCCCRGSHGCKTRSLAGSALVGGMLLGLIEGMGLLMNNFMSRQYRPVDPREEQQAMQMPEDSASLGQQQEGGLLKGIFSWKKSKCAFFIQFEKPWIDCKVVCIVVRLAATQHFNMQ